MTKRLTLCASSPLGTFAALVLVTLALAIYGWLAIPDESLRVSVYAALSSAVFPNRATPLPPGWTAGDIGTSSRPGLTRFNGWAFTMAAGSGDNSQTTDHYTFLSTPAPDEFTLTARITGMDGDIEFNPAAPNIVDTTNGTLDIGGLHGMADGDPVVYHHGEGGSDIGGLHDGETYYIGNAGGGKIKLYNDERSAKRVEEQGRAHLASAGAGTRHVLQHAADRDATNRAGLMVRESTAPGSRFVAIILTPAQIGIISRAATGGPTTSTVVGNSSGVTYLRLARTGPGNYALSFGDGTNWNNSPALGNVAAPMANPIVGLAVNTRGAANFSARFDDVSFNNTIVSGFPVSIFEGLSTRLKHLSKPQVLVLYGILIFAGFFSVRLAGRVVRSYRFVFSGEALERREMWLFLPAWAAVWIALGLLFLAISGPTGANWNLSIWLAGAIVAPVLITLVAITFFPDAMARARPIKFLKPRVPRWALLLVITFIVCGLVATAGPSLAHVSMTLPLPAWLVLAILIPPVPLAIAWLFVPRLAALRLFIPGFRRRIEPGRVKRLEILDNGEGSTELVVTLRDDRAWTLSTGTPKALQRLAGPIARLLGLQRRDMATWT